MPFGLNLGGGQSKSRSSQEVWGPQATGLQNLYTQAGNFFNQGNPYLNNALNMGSMLTPGMAAYGQQALPAWNNLLTGGQFGGQNFDVSASNNMANAQGAGFDTLRGMMSPQENPYLQQMFGAGTRALTDTFNNQILPGISGGAEMGGGLGGSRQGIAEGLAAQGAQQALGDYGANFFGGQYAGDMNRALTAAGVYNTGQQAGINTNMMLGQGVDQTGLNALGQGMNAMNLGFTGPNLYNQLYGMQWQPYANFANIMGQPTVLGSTKSDSLQLDMGFMPR